MDSDTEFLVKTVGIGMAVVVVLSGFMIWGSIEYNKGEEEKMKNFLIECKKSGETDLKCEWMAKVMRNTDDAALSSNMAVSVSIMTSGARQGK